MINNLLTLLTFENIYLIANWGVIPFWFLLIVLPNHQITNFFVQSIIVPLLLAAGYAYLSYDIYLDGNIFAGFELYRGLDGLYSMFSNEVFVVNFLVTFFSNKFIYGRMDCKRLKKYLIPKIVTIPSLLLTYFTGPIGLVFYWFMRIFFAKKISFND